MFLSAHEVVAEKKLSVLLSNLEIVERSNHTFIPSYVPAGQDATVSWGAPDFKFKNNRNYPIKIVATSSNRTISVNIYGLKTNDDYTVKIESSRVGTIPFSTEYKDDPSLPVGTSSKLNHYEKVFTLLIIGTGSADIVLKLHQGK